MLVSCPNIKLECAKHCFHFLPHEMIEICRIGTCPVTYKKCECTNTPKIDLSKHLSTSTGEFK